MSNAKHKRKVAARRFIHLKSDAHVAPRPTDLVVLKHLDQVVLRSWCRHYANAHGIVIGEPQVAFGVTSYRIQLRSGIRLWVALSDLEPAALPAARASRPDWSTLDPYQRAVHTDDGHGVFA